MITLGVIIYIIFFLILSPFTYALCRTAKDADKGAYLVRKNDLERAIKAGKLSPEEIERQKKELEKLYKELLL